jgi:hypothetical protein
MALPNTIRQVGYVVGDLDRTIAGFCAQGIGPWFVLHDVEQDDSTYRGEPSAPVLDIAFSSSGSVQLEVIQQRNDAPSMYRDFLATGASGLHHVAWWTEDLDAVTAEVAAKGWPALQAGGRYTYFDTPTGVLEITLDDDLSRAMNEMVAAAADAWDGITDPVRSFG